MSEANNTAAPVLQAQDLKREYSVSRGLFATTAMLRALDGVSFSVRAGQPLAVVGESGCGKSTLARLLTMIEPPTSGQLLIDGVGVAQSDAATRRRLRRQIQIVFQNPYGSLNPRRDGGRAFGDGGFAVGNAHDDGMITCGKRDLQLHPFWPRWMRSIRVIRRVCVAVHDPN